MASKSIYKFIIYMIMGMIGFTIYKLNTVTTSINTFEPLWRTLHTSGASISKTLIMSHRGSRYLLPENTLLAFKTALDIGTDVVETDVRLSSDGVLVVFHDHLIDRTTNYKGQVESYTLEQLKSFDAGYGFTPDNGTTYPYRNRNIRIPTCREMLNELPEKTPLNIEIKENDLKVARALWNELEYAFENRARTRPTRSVVISCRFCEPTAYIRELAREYQIRNGLKELPIATSGCEKEVTRFVILSQLYLAKIWYTIFPLNTFEVFQVPPVSGPIQLDNSRFIDAAHHFGKHVHFWVINNATDMERILKSGIEGIITDRPDIAVRVFRENGLKPADHKIPKPLPANHTGTYFIPSIDIEEAHTCISLMCIIFQRIHHIIIALVFTFIMLKFINAKKRNQPPRRHITTVETKKNK